MSIQFAWLQFKIHAKNAYVFINPFQTFEAKLYIYM
jgi:hypothetical protein